jgi:hypothetical protein
MKKRKEKNQTVEGIGNEERGEEGETDKGLERDRKRR